MLKYQFNVLLLGSSVVLGIALFDTIVSMQNRDSQMALSKRQQFVQQTVPLETLYRDLIKSLAEIALKTDDKKIISMLAEQGITVTSNVSSGTDPSMANKK